MARLAIAVVFMIACWCDMTASAIISVSKTCCPVPYTQVGSECFLLFTALMKWDDARRVCNMIGGDLAVPSDIGALFSFVFPAATTLGVWIGGTDQDNEGVWDNYINGEPIPDSGWEDNQPDDFGGWEDCLELRRYFSPPLNDYVCVFPQNFVCEVPCVPKEKKCPPPSTKLGDECFYVSNDALPWNDARQHCNDLGGDLAVPSDVPTFDNYVFTIAAGPGVWIGGTDQASEGVWNYINGELIPDGVWEDDQPDDYGSGEDCLEIRSYFNPPVNDYKCYRDQEFVCEFAPV